MKRKRVRSCLPIAVGIIVVCLTAGIASGSIRIKVDRTSCDSVLWAFAEAMRRNQGERAKSFTSPEQWYRIDSWVAG